LTVDGERVELSHAIAYRGMQISGVPNMAFAFGYTNQSWTLGSDLTCERLCRLLIHMDRHGYAVCTPRADGTVAAEPFADLSSGYIQRSIGDFPRQGVEVPWKRIPNYALNWRELRRDPIEDPALEFSRAPVPVAA
jgi:hypothetical protein